MPDHVLAEQLLSVVMVRDRASGVVGDLLEAVPRRGTTWFWLRVGQTVLSCVGRDFAAAPLVLAGSAVVTWFGYMLVVLLLGGAVGVSMSLLGLAFDLAAGHTGLELIANPLIALSRWAVGFAAPTEWLVMIAAAPFLSGLRIADVWRERAVALVAAMGIVWAAMVTLVPLAGFQLRVGVGHLPFILLFLLIGVVFQRSRHLPARLVA